MPWLKEVIRFRYMMILTCTSVVRKSLNMMHKLVSFMVLPTDVAADQPEAAI